MKKTILAVILSVFCLLAAGCVRMDADITINENGKADFSLTVVTMTDEDTNSADYDLTGEQITAFLDKGMTYCPFEEDNYSGYQLSGKNLAPSDIIDVYNSNQSVLTQRGNQYTLDWDYMADNTDGTLSDIDRITDNDGYLKLTLNLPENAVLHSSNATEISEDGRTLTWDILQMDPGEHVTAEFTLQRSMRTFIMIGVIAVILIAVIIAFILLRKSLGIGEEVIIDLSGGSSDESSASDESSSDQ